MNRKLTTAVVIFCFALATVPAAAETLTSEERERIVAHLERTLGFFLNEVKDLSEAQWNFKPGPDRWSVAECAEHIALSEETLRNLILNQVLKSPATPDRQAELKGKEDQVIRFLLDRSQKFQAPDAVRPSNRWNAPAETVQAFEAGRAKTLDLARTNQEDLRSHIAPGPSGDLDAYQWLFFISAHTERHTLQIQEVKAHPDFPKE